MKAARRFVAQFRMNEIKVVSHWFSLVSLPFVYYREEADWSKEKVKVFTRNLLFFFILYLFFTWEVR